MTPLCELARKHGTDKGGEHLQRGDTCHRYTEHYHKMFKNRRKDIKTVLEIGVAGGHSLRMWRDYFPNATIYGIDSNPACIFNDGRIRCFVADQYNESDLLTTMCIIGEPELDLVVDDGSHEPAHQIFTAQVLLPYLSTNGIYVIEDIEPDCQPQLIGNPIIQGMTTRSQPPTCDYVWNPLPTGRGIGRAYCRCGCETGEQLVVIRHV